MKIKFTYISALSLSLLLLAWGMQLGYIHTQLNQLPGLLLDAQRDPVLYGTIMHIRLPRLCLAFLAGAALSISGLTLQLLSSNPLADAYTTGSAGGAALGVNMALSGFLPLWWMGGYVLPLYAFLGALAAIMLVTILSYYRGRLLSDRLLLAGVSISMFCSSIVGLLIYRQSQSGDVKSMIFWTLGGFEKATWQQVPLLLIILMVCLIALSALNKTLTILMLGDQKAHNLGLHSGRVKSVFLVIVALLSGSATAVAGIIPFVGIIIPHFVRSVTGITSVHKIILSAWIGGNYLLFCDLASRWLAKPGGMPVGIITSFAGIPFFLYLLSKKNYRFS